MQPLLKEYLDGTLKSTGTATKGEVRITNDLGVPLWAGFVATDGTVFPAIPVPVGGGRRTPLPLNWYWLLWSPDGSLAAVFPGTTGNFLELTIGPADLSSPGDIGPVPTPTEEVPIPNDSPSILVGAGKRTVVGADVYVTRAQFWKRSGDSISLAPTEEVTTGYTSSTGLQETSSDTETVAKSVDASLSAGWGPVSASLSASLNTSSTSFQQYVSTQNDTRYETRTYKGNGTFTQLIFRWQLYDVVTVSNATNKVLAQVTTAQQPDIVKIYREGQLPASARPVLSGAERQQINEILAELDAGGTDAP